MDSVNQQTLLAVRLLYLYSDRHAEEVRLPVIPRHLSKRIAHTL